MAINESFTIDDLDLSLITKEAVEESIKQVQRNYVNHFVDSELHKYLAEQMDEFIDEEEDEENKKQLELSKESLRQKRLAHIKMIWQSAENIKTLQTLLSKI